MLEQSFLMRALTGMGFRRLAWSFRRIHCPVPRNALVLEVGSGENPYSRSNVLLDAYEATRERHWAPLMADRPIVLGFVESLPFRDQSFDFVIASHVLEHSRDPQRFISELQRVAKAGYIEVPDAFMERINPYKDHRLEITVRNQRLIIRKKNTWKVDSHLVELYENRAKKIIASETIRNHPFEFHVRYYWRGRIDYEIVNPEDDIGWPSPHCDRPASIPGGLRQRIGQSTLFIFRRILSQRRRNSAIDLSSLLACPTCHGISLEVTETKVVCVGCGMVYKVQNGIPVMHVSEQYLSASHNNADSL